MSEGLDCQKCGACCVLLDPPTWVLEEEEINVPRLREIADVIARAEAETKTQMSGADMPSVRRGQQYMCAALEGVVGVQCGCSINDVKPSLCKEFEPGSLLCDLMRKASLPQGPIV